MSVHINGKRSFLSFAFIIFFHYLFSSCPLYKTDLFVSSVARWVFSSLSWPLFFFLFPQIWPLQQQLERLWHHASHKAALMTGEDRVVLIRWLQVWSHRVHQPPRITLGFFWARLSASCEGHVIKNISWKCAKQKDENKCGFCWGPPIQRYIWFLKYEREPKEQLISTSK